MAIAQKAPETVTAENDDGDTSLSHCYTGESVDMLVDLGADPCHRNKVKRTPLHAAGNRAQSSTGSYTKRYFIAKRLCAFNSY